MISTSMDVLNVAWEARETRESWYEKERARLKRKALRIKKAEEAKRKYSVPLLWCNFD